MTQAEASSSTKETGFVANTEKTLNDTIKVSSSEELLQKVFDKEKYYPAVTNDKKESFTIELTQAELNQLRKDISPLDTNDKEQRIIQYYNTKREIIRKANESQTFLRDARDIIDTLNIETVKQSLELMVKNPGFAPSVASELIDKLYYKDYVVHIKKDSTTTPNKEKIYITHENTSINPKAKDLEYVINEYLNATSSDKKIDISYFKKGLIYQTSWSKLKDFIKKNTDTTWSRLIDWKLKISDYVDHLKKEYEIDTDLTEEIISKKVTYPRDRNFLLSYINSDFKEDDKKNNAMNNTMEDYAKRSVELWLNLKNILWTQENTKIETPKCSVDVPKETKDDLQNIDWSKEWENFIKAPVSTALRLTWKVVSNSWELAPFVLIWILYFWFKFLTWEVDIKGHKIAWWQVLIWGLAGLWILKGTWLTDMELPNLRTTEGIKKGVKKIKDKLSNQAEKAKIKLQILKDFWNNIDEEWVELITNNWHFYSKDWYALWVPIDNWFYKMDDLKKVAYIDQNIPDGANIWGNLGIQDEDKNDFKNFIQTIYNKWREKFRSKDANFDDIVKNKNLILKDCINIIYANNFNAAFNALSIKPQQTTPENSSLTNGQKKGIEKIMSNTEINTIMDSQYRGLSINLKDSIKNKDDLLKKYIEFIHNTQFLNLNLDKVIYTNDPDEWIFFNKPKLNNAIIYTDPIKPLILKRILRVYFWKSYDYIDLNNFKQTYREDTYKTKTVKDFIEGIYVWQGS